MTRIFVDKMVSNDKKIQEDAKNQGVMKYYGTGNAGSCQIHPQCPQIFKVCL